MRSGQRFPRRAGVAGTVGTLIVWTLGQSNLEGRDLTLIQPTAPGNSLKLDYDGVLYPYQEPGISDTNSLYPIETHVSAQSMFGSFCDRMRALNIAQRIVIVNSPKSNTTSAQWAATVPFGSSPVQIYGIARLRLQAALQKFPGARVCIVIYQGESDSSLMVDATAHQANWTTVLNDARAFVLSLGGVLAGHNTYNIRLPVTAWTLGPFWTTVDDQKVAHAVTDQAMRLVQAANGPWVDGANLHLNRIGQNATGVELANAMALDFGWTPDTPYLLPSAANLLGEWRAFATGSTLLELLEMRISGAGPPPACTLTGTGVTFGTLAAAYGIRAEIVTAGTLGVSRVKISQNNGATFSDPVFTAATLAIGATGITLNMPAGNYATDNVFEGIWLSTVPTQPNTAGAGTLARVGSQSQARMLTAGLNGRPAAWLEQSLADEALSATYPGMSGTNKPFTVFHVAWLVGLDGTNRTLWQMQDSVAAGKVLFEASSTAFRMRRVDDASTVVSQSGGAPSATVPHIFEAVFDGAANLSFYVDGVLSFTGTFPGVGAMTISSFSIGRSGIGTAMNIKTSDWLGYNAALDSENRSLVRRMLRLRNGTP